MRGWAAGAPVTGSHSRTVSSRPAEATGSAQNLYGQAKDAARQASDAAVGYAKEAYENSGDTFRDGSQAIADKVQENPLREVSAFNDEAYAHHWFEKALTRKGRR